MKERENERIRFWREELPRQVCLTKALSCSLDGAKVAAIFRFLVCPSFRPEEASLLATLKVAKRNPKVLHP